MTPNGFISDENLPETELVLFCLPHAGGGTSVFHRLRSLVPSWLRLVPICLPGREARFSEPAYTELGPLVTDLADAIRPHLPRTYAFLGYSMGALVFFELVREFRRQNLPLPCLFIVAAARAPHLVPKLEPLHHLPDQQFLTALHCRYGGIPEKVRDNRELVASVTPTLRADFQVLETYQYQQATPLEVDLLALGGREDQAIMDPELAAWQQHITGCFSLQLLPGGHLFLTDSSSNTPKSAMHTIIDHLRPFAGK